MYLTHTFLLVNMTQLNQSIQRDENLPGIHDSEQQFSQSMNTQYWENRRITGMHVADVFVT